MINQINQINQINHWIEGYEYHFELSESPS